MDPGYRTEIPFFVEEQRFRQWWLWLIIAAPVAVAWYGFWRQIIQGESFGNHPAPDWAMWLLWLGVGLVLPWILYSLALRVEVRQGTLAIRFTTPLFPLFRKTIRLEQVQSAEDVTYRPLRDYGGWGIRFGAKGTAYTMSGSRGVKLRLGAGASILIGSHQADRLADAIQQALAER